MRNPVGERLDFLRRQHRKNQVRIPRLPRDCLGFVQRQPKESLLRFERGAGLGENGCLGPLDLRQNLPARYHANGPKSVLVSDLSLWLDCFHMVWCFLICNSYSYIMTQKNKLSTVPR